MVYYTKTTSSKDGHKICSKCFREKGINEFYNQKGSRDGKRSSCTECVKKYNKAKGRINLRKYYSKNPHKAINKIVGRDIIIAERTPAWADKSILRWYAEQAITLTNITGISYSVDHEIPLVGKYVSGLNVGDNLQIITTEKNTQKSMSYKLDSYI